MASASVSTPAPEGGYQFYVLEDPHTHGDHADGHSGEVEHHHETGTMLGFWIYLMSDCLIFGILFAVYAVLGQNYAAGPAPADLFELDKIAWATAFLLLSSITYGFSVINMYENKQRMMMIWLMITGVFGLAFLWMSILEFQHLWHIGAGPGASAFLSAFWLLVGTHGLHVACGALWLVVLLVQIQMHGLTHENKRRVMCLSLFWHFLDLIWIAVFSFVYLTGVLL